MYIKLLGARAYVRQATQLQLSWDGVDRTKMNSTNHRRNWMKIMEGGNLATSEVDKCKLRVWNKHFELITESFQNPDKYNKPYQYNAFTDSSAKSGKVGCGIV